MSLPQLFIAIVLFSNTVPKLPSLSSYRSPKLQWLNAPIKFIISSFRPIYWLKLCPRSIKNSPEPQNALWNYIIPTPKKNFETLSKNGVAHFVHDMETFVTHWYLLQLIFEKWQVTIVGDAVQITDLILLWHIHNSCAEVNCILLTLSNRQLPLSEPIII